MPRAAAKRTTVVFPAGLKKRAVAEARHQRISFGELLRRSLEQTLSQPRKRPKGRDPLWDNVPVYDGPVPADLSSNHDKYLYDEEP